MQKKKRWLMIFATMVLLAVLIIISCDLLPSIPDILQGAGIWGESRYGKPVFGNRKSKNGNYSFGLKNKEDLNIWKLEL